MFLLAASCLPTASPCVSVVFSLHHTTGQQLVVQNMSLQTDSTDLLGGFKPVQLRFIAEVNDYQFSAHITFSGIQPDYSPPLVRYPALNTAACLCMST